MIFHKLGLFDLFGCYSMDNTLMKKVV